MGAENEAASTSMSYKLGLLFIVIVSIIWSAASVLTQHIYCDLGFDSPFLLTVIGSSLFIMWLPLYEIQSLWSGEEEEDPGSISLHAIRSTERDEAFNDSITNHTQSSEFDRNYSHGIDIGNSSKKNDGYFSDDRPVVSMLTKRDTFKIALFISPLWLLSNVFYNLSLQWTSISSSTVISSTGSLFAFFFSVLVKDEKFSSARLFGVLFFVVGSIFTGYADTDSSEDSCGVPLTNSTNDSSVITNMGERILEETDPEADIPNARLFGDLASLLSAVGYGAYTVGLRKFCPDESKISMQLLFGYIGLINFLLCFPIIIIIWYAGIIEFPSITWSIFGWIFIKGFFDNVISDYLWARSVILTSATVASVGVGLTIPLAFLSDILMGRWEPDAASLIGGCGVLIGFLIVNAYTDDHSVEKGSGKISRTGEDYQSVLSEEEDLMSESVHI